MLSKSLSPLSYKDKKDDSNDKDYSSSETNCLETKKLEK
ncbi:hypothetical protein M565_ctg5P0405 [Vibrio cyclitrophicus FF75]|nr:hypothetical protein M565_ctg5P0405 [Vibrio cyclitrophicus FF75]